MSYATSPFLFYHYIMKKSEDTISRYLRLVGRLCTVPEGTLNLNKKYIGAEEKLHMYREPLLSASTEGIYLLPIANRTELLNSTRKIGK